ncbi:hypothetical protein EI94DRAFT_1789382, partial [Lactarius quietus]
MKILEADDNDRDDNDDSHKQDEDAQLPGALKISGGGQYQGDDDLEAQIEVFTTHCLENLMEAFLVPSTLLCTTTLKKISLEFPSSIVHEIGLLQLLFDRRTANRITRSVELLPKCTNSQHVYAVAVHLDNFGASKPNYNCASGSGEEQGNTPSGQGLGSGIVDMTIIQNLAHRSKDQVEEALSLIAELLPPLPKGMPPFGIYDPKAYMEKLLARLSKARAKANSTATRQAQHMPLYVFAGVLTPLSSAMVTPAPASGTATPTSADSPHEADELPNTTKESPPDRTEMLRTRVITMVRIKMLTGLLKAISYLEGDKIKQVFAGRISNFPATRNCLRSLDPKDAVTLRVHVIRFQYLRGKGSTDADNVFGMLHHLVEQISDTSSSKKEVRNALKELAMLLTSAHTPVWSLELLQSGVIDGLLQFATDKTWSISLARHQELLLNTFIICKSKVLAGSQTPFAIFDKKLQEGLTRVRCLLLSPLRKAWATQSTAARLYFSLGSCIYAWSLPKAQTS